MSNEELAALIKAGETERMGELWEQVARLVKWKASRIMTALELRGNPCGVTFDDLYQSGFIALTEAVHYYTPEDGAAFSTCLMNRLKTVFAELTGYRTKTGRCEPLNNAFCLDKPLTDDADTSFGDLVPDQRADAAMESVEERQYQKHLQEAMETALSAIPEQYADVLRMRHYEGLTLAEVGEIRGVAAERVRQMESKGLRLLRQPKNACNLFPFYQHDFYSHTGLTAFRQSGLTVQERYLIAVEEQQARAAARRKQREEQIWKEQTRDNFNLFLEQLQAETDEIVARMTPEEKRAILERCGV